MKSFVALEIVWFTGQIVMFGAALSRIVTVENYYRYYAVGAYAALLYSVSSYIVFNISEEGEHGIVDYLLSLPISRRALSVGRALGSTVRTVLFTLPALAILLATLGTFSVQGLVALAAVEAAFVFGASSLVISIASLLKSGDKIDILFGAIDAFIVRLSTVIYPRVAMPALYAAAASANPLSYAADLIREALSIPVVDAFDPALALTLLLAFTIGMLTVAIYAYERALEGGGWY